jgi:hypothetical protein
VEVPKVNSIFIFRIRQRAGRLALRLPRIIIRIMRFSLAGAPTLTMASDGKGGRTHSIDEVATSDTSGLHTFSKRSGKWKFPK